MESLLKLFERDLNKLMEELTNFKQEKDLWITEGEIKNSAGNLTLHIVGNLNHFIGAVIGNSGYIRNRDKEFSRKNVSRDQLKEMVRNTIQVISETLTNLDNNILGKEYPIEVFGEKMTYEYFLIHLEGHLNYHLGQINYLRRILQL